MLLKVFSGIMIPFIGTMIGSGIILIIKKEVSTHIKNIMSALAGGIMLSASIWSLIIPSLEMNGARGIEKTTEVGLGFIAGILTMIFTDRTINFLTYKSNKYTNFGTKTIMQYIAVTAHNIPEGMAVGMAFASLLSHGENIVLTPAILLAFGIAVQNIPEGAIVTMPLIAENKSRKKTILWGFFSGIVEPLGAVLAITASKTMAVMLPFFMSFAAGAMVYVVTEQLTPDMYEKEGNKKGIITLVYSLGFLLMMSLDVIFG